MTPRCPSDLALETHLLEPATSGLAPHLDGCAACQARLSRMEREGEEFRRFVFPATVEAVEQAAEKARPRARFLSFLAPVTGLVATAAAVILVLRPVPSTDGPPPGYQGGIKGGPMTLSVYVNGVAGAHAVEDGAAVPANAEIGFMVKPSEACRLWIVSVDAAGQVSRLYPATGEAPAVSGAATLPGGAVLDGTAGPERIYAVCAPEALPYATVERAARSAAGGGAERVRAAKGLGGLPDHASQATLLLEKKT